MKLKNSKLFEKIDKLIGDHEAVFYRTVRLPNSSTLCAVSSDGVLKAPK